MNCRTTSEFIIVTIIPHLFTLYFTFDNLIYTTIILSSSLSSYIWHKYHEPSNYLLAVDYILAGTLSYYEIFIMYNNNKAWFYFSIYVNMFVFTFNQLVYILSLNNIIKYSRWHSLYHIMSSVKSIFLGYLSQ